MAENNLWIPPKGSPAMAHKLGFLIVDLVIGLGSVFGFWYYKLLCHPTFITLIRIFRPSYRRDHTGSPTQRS